MALATPSSTRAQSYDVIIRNGRVIGGTGNPWFFADVALDGDRIAGCRETVTGLLKLNRDPA